MGNFTNSCKYIDDTDIISELDSSNSDLDLVLEKNDVFDTDISWLNPQEDRCHRCLHCDKALDEGYKFCGGCGLCVKHLEEKCYECMKTLKWLDLAMPQGVIIIDRFFAKHGLDEPKHEIFENVCRGCMYEEHCADNGVNCDLTLMPDLTYLDDLTYERIARAMTDTEHYGRKGLTRHHVHMAGQKC